MSSERSSLSCEKTLPDPSQIRMTAEIPQMEVIHMSPVLGALVSENHLQLFSEKTVASLRGITRLALFKKNEDHQIKLS